MSSPTSVATVAWLSPVAAASSPREAGDLAMRWRSTAYRFAVLMSRDVRFTVSPPLLGPLRRYGRPRPFYKGFEKGLPEVPAREGVITTEYRPTA